MVIYMSNKKQVVKKRRRVKLWVWVVIATILLSTVFISIGKIILWQLDNNKSKGIKDEVDTIAEVDEIEDNENTELINEPTDQNSDYWYYISFPLINVDFSELKKKNSDTVAWINVNNTNINYPIVQTSDNDFYLDHSYDKSYNEAGWVFLDYRNDSSFSDKNTIIYAHSRLDKTMFGSLSKTLKPEWYENKDNHIIRISNEKENSLWQIFSVYVIETESYYITTNFNSDEEYLTFLETMKSRSRYDFDTNLSASDRIITLSTCYDDDRKTVVHAKLIKRELK